MPQEYTGVPVIPELEKKDTTRPTFDMDEAAQKRADYVRKRLLAMKREKDKYMPRKRTSLMLFDNILRLSGDPSEPIKREEIVAPLARIFVEAKTSEEVRVMSEYQFYPVDDGADVPKAELLMEIVDHIRRQTGAKVNKHELLRMKNIIGVSIKWKGFRSLKRTIKETKKTDENGNPTEWEDRVVPWKEDIFEEVIDPFNFYVDPTCKTMNDAMDCGYYFALNYEEALEQYGRDPRFNFKDMKPGSDNLVEFFVYFNKTQDLNCIYAWPSSGYGVLGIEPGYCKEVYYGPLPDEHKELPFISYHNQPTFTVGFFQDVVQARAPRTGEAATYAGSISAKQGFWTIGDPEIIMDLIELRSGFGRSLYRIAELAGRSIVATDEGYKFDTSKDWEHGEQAIGMKEHFENATFSVGNIGPLQVSIDDVYNLMIQAIGIDPRTLADSKGKTATETIAQRETSMRRLEEGLLFNEENGEVRDGYLTFKLIQQHYTVPMAVRLTGQESEEELKRFDSVEGEHPMTGKPLIGRRYKRITTRRRLKEMHAGKQNVIAKDHHGAYSFIARPEYIRVSEMDIATITTRRAGEIRALEGQQAKEGIQLWLEMAQFTVPTATGGKPLLRAEELPPLSLLVKKYNNSLGITGTEQQRGQQKDERKEKLSAAYEQYKAGQQELMNQSEAVAK